MRYFCIIETSTESFTKSTKGYSESTTPTMSTTITSPGKKRYCVVCPQSVDDVHLTHLLRQSEQFNETLKIVFTLNNENLMEVVFKSLLQ